MPSTSTTSRQPIRPTLAQDFDPGLWRSGMMIGEKLDGVRAIWDGTRLRTRTGNRIAAPAWFTQSLGPVMLDGELFIGRDPGDFDTVSGLVRTGQEGTGEDDDRWRRVRFAAFDLYMGRGNFRARHKRLCAMLNPESDGGAVYAHRHRGVTDFASAKRLLDEVVERGGEGIVIRDPDQPYTPGRGMGLFRMKPTPDLDAIVTGYIGGKGRLTELAGALICHVQGMPKLEFHLGNGLTDRDRIDPPRVGQRVIVAHSGLTSGGLPRLPVYKGLRAEQPHDGSAPVLKRPPDHVVPRAICSL